MPKKCNGNIRETIAAIDFVRTAKSQAPSENETIQNILMDNEKILMERLLQLSRQERAPVMNEQQLPSKTKSKGKEVIENGNDPRRTD